MVYSKGDLKGSFLLGFSEKPKCYEHVAELVYAYVSEAYGVILGSSSLPVLTAIAAAILRSLSYLSFIEILSYI